MGRLRCHQRWSPDRRIGTAADPGRPGATPTNSRQASCSPMVACRRPRTPPGTRSPCACSRVRPQLLLHRQLGFVHWRWHINFAHHGGRAQASMTSGVGEAPSRSTVSPRCASGASNIGPPRRRCGIRRSRPRGRRPPAVRREGWHRRRVRRSAGRAGRCPRSTGTRAAAIDHRAREAARCRPNNG